MKNCIQKMTAILFAVLFLSVSAASAQVTEFIYQGSLKDNGSPANANYDFEFAMFDAHAGVSNMSGSSNSFFGAGGDKGPKGIGLHEKQNRPRSASL